MSDSKVETKSPVTESTSKVSNTTKLNHLSDITLNSNRTEGQHEYYTDNVSNVAENEHVSATGDWSNTKEFKHGADTTDDLNTTANKEVADTINGSDTDGGDRPTGSNTTANKEVDNTTNDLNTSANKVVADKTYASDTTANKEVTGRTDGSNTTKNNEAAATPNGSNTSENKVAVDTNYYSNSHSNEKVADTTNGSNTTENKKAAATPKESNTTSHKEAACTTNVANTAESKVTSKALKSSLYTERAGKKQDDQQNSKKTSLVLKEPRCRIGRPDNDKRIKEIKEMEVMKEYESKEDALNPNSKCSTEHMESLLCVVTKGVLVQSDDQFKLKSQVVNYSLSVNLQQPSLTDTKCEQKFQKQIDMERLDDKVRLFGLDVDVSASVGTHPLKLDASNSTKEENDDETDKIESEIFLAIAKYAFVPIQSFHLLQNYMRIDATALKDIKYIVELIKELGSENRSVHEKSYDFLIKYGSHVSTGTHHVGGIFKMYTVCNDTTKASYSKCLQTLRHEHALFMEAMMTIAVGEGENSNSHVQRSHRETSSHDNTLTVENMCTRFGGPYDAENFRQWKEGLIQNPDTWTVIHRSEITGIWNILLNHKSDIGDCTKVAGLLKRTWEKNWGKSSNIKEVDNTLIEHIMYMMQEKDLTQNCSAETIMHLLKECTCIIAGNPKFGTYTTGGKWNEFLRKAVSFTDELDLENRFRLKIVLSVAEQRLLTSDECLSTWFEKPLLCCAENIVEKIKSFIQKDFRHAYATVIEVGVDQYWRNQVESQAVIEIGRIICHYGENLTDVTACIVLAEIAVQLPYDFITMKQKSKDSSCNTIDIFFSSISRLRQKKTFTCGLKGLPQILTDFVSLIENDYFKTMEISSVIFLSVDQQKLQKTMHDEMSVLCKDMLEKSFQSNNDFVKLALIAVFWSDKNRSEYMKSCQRLEESKKVFHTGKILWCQDGKIEQLQELSCFDVLTFMPGFINTIKFYIQTDESFEQIGIDCCLKLFKRFHEIIFLNDIDDHSRRNCIEFEFIRCKAQQALSKNGVSEIRNFEDIENLLTEMEKSVDKGKKSVCFVSTILASEKDFLCEFRKVIIPAWKEMVDRLQTHKDYQKAEEHINTFFVDQLKDLCDDSCDKRTNEIRNDIRRKLGIYLFDAKSKQKITWKKVEDNVEIGNSIIRRHVINFLAFVAFLFNMTRRKLSTMFFDFYHER